MPSLSKADIPTHRRGGVDAVAYAKAQRKRATQKGNAKGDAHDQKDQKGTEGLYFIQLLNI